MKNLNIKGTKYTPKVKYSNESCTLEISGFSLPEDISKFYSPINNWLLEFYENPPLNKKLTVIFKLSYYNSGSLKALIEIVKITSKIKTKGYLDSIYWYYDEGDNQILDSGKELSEILKIPFDFQIIPS